MNLISFYYFLEICKEMNITKTAQRLFTSQQTLSSHIQKLEGRYGLQLFERKPRLQLTYAGEYLRESAARILAEEENLSGIFQSITQEGIGVLRLGIPAYRAQVCLPMILPAFYRKWPRISLELVEHPSQEMLQMLQDGTLDLCIGAAAEPDERFEMLPLLDDFAQLVVSDALIERYCQADLSELKLRAIHGTTLAEFSEMPYMLLKPPMRLRQVAESCFRAAGFRPQILIEASNTELLLALNSKNFGAFFCTQTRLPLIRDAYPHTNVFPLLYDGDFFHHQLVIAYHRKRYLPPHIKDFIELTRLAFEEISQMRLDTVEQPAKCCGRSE